jgi:hypothetical protein
MLPAEIRIAALDLNDEHAQRGECLKNDAINAEDGDLLGRIATRRSTAGAPQAESRRAPAAAPSGLRHRHDPTPSARRPRATPGRGPACPRTGRGGTPLTWRCEFVPPSRPPPRSPSTESTTRRLSSALRPDYRARVRGDAERRTSAPYDAICLTSRPFTRRAGDPPRIDFARSALREGVWFRRNEPPQCSFTHRFVNAAALS